jgi:hypothetical protein
MLGWWVAQPASKATDATASHTPDRRIAAQRDPDMGARPVARGIRIRAQASDRRDWIQSDGTAVKQPPLNGNLSDDV